MFYHIEGSVTNMEPGLAVIDCGGVGYALNTTANTISQLSLGSRAKLYTYLQVREDIFELYGFFSIAEKKSFELLIGVSGVGPKAAISILSANTPEALAMAILNSDERALTVAQGIGKKIAQRIILELRDRMQKEAGALGAGGVLNGAVPGGHIAGGPAADAAAALEVLGYSAAEIAAALKTVEAEGRTTEEIIRLALRGMVK